MYARTPCGLFKGLNVLFKGLYGLFKGLQQNVPFLRSLVKVQRTVSMALSAAQELFPRDGLNKERDTCFFFRLQCT